MHVYIHIVSFHVFLQSGHNSIDSMGYAGTKKQIFAKTCIYKVSIIYFLSLIYEITSHTFSLHFQTSIHKQSSAYDDSEQGW